MKDKSMDLSESIDRFVNDGDSISLGGFTINRNPIAATYEIIRQGVENLHMFMHSGGQHFDLLVGTNTVISAEIAYGANARYAPTCRRFREKVQSGELDIEDYSNLHMTMRFMGGAIGVPFMPVKSGMETDIENKWGFSEEYRKNNKNVANKKLVRIDNPFSNKEDDSLLLLPSINPDVTIIHAQKADIEGNVRIEGLEFTDIEQIKASKKVIITCEELFRTDKLRETPENNAIPSFLVDAVVQVPFGAHPTACYNYYDYDSKHLKEYYERAQDDKSFKKYVRDYILDPDSFIDYLDKIGIDSIIPLLADSDKGYSTGLER